MIVLFVEYVPGHVITNFYFFLHPPWGRGVNGESDEERRKFDDLTKKFKIVINGCGKIYGGGESGGREKVKGNDNMAS